MVSQYRNTETLPSFAEDAYMTATKKGHVRTWDLSSIGGLFARYGVDISKHTSQHGQKRKTRSGEVGFDEVPLGCKCGCMSDFSLHKHATDCLAVGIVDFLRGGGGERSALLPSVGLIEGQTFANATTWPHLTVSEEHLIQAGSCELWDRLARKVFAPKGGNSVYRRIKVTFLPSIATPISKFAAPTLVAMRTDQRYGETTLYGNGAELDGTWIDTPQGALYAVISMMQIAEGFNTAKWFLTGLTIFDLARLNCEVHPVTRTRTTLEAYHDDMARQWAALQRPEVNAWGMVERYIMAKLTDYQADNSSKNEATLLMSPECVTMVQRMNTGQVAWSWAGPSGPGMYQMENYIGELRIMNRPVMSIAPFKLPGVDGDIVRVSPMEARIDIGEYAYSYVDIHRVFWRGELDINMHIDGKFTALRFEEMVDRCQCFGEHGNMRTVPAGSRFPPRNEGKSLTFIDIIAYDKDDKGESETLKKFRATMKLWIDESMENDKKVGELISRIISAGEHGELGEIKDPHERLIHVYLGLPLTRGNVKAVLNEGLPPPFGMIVAQIHQQCTTVDIAGVIEGKAVACVDIPGTTVISDGQTGKRVISSYKDLGVLVEDERNVAASRNAIVTAVGAGFGSDAINPDVYNPDVFEYGGSVAYIIVPVGWKKTPDNLCLLKSFDTLGKRFGDEITQERFDELYGYPSSAFYDDMFGWTTMKLGSDRRMQTCGTVQIPYPTNCVCRPMCFERHVGCSPDSPIKKELVLGNGYWRREGTIGVTLKSRVLEILKSQ